MRDFPAERKRIDIGDYYPDDTLFRRVDRLAAARRRSTEGLAQSLAYFRAHLAEYL